MKRLIKTIAVLMTLSVFGLFVIVGIFFYISSDLPKINSLEDYNPPMNSKIFSKDGELLMEIGTETREVVPFDKIPSLVVGAFLAAEDDNFYHHQGIDYYGIARAFLVNMKEGKLVQGGSTITQQVAKSFLLSKERTLSRKVKDLLLARKIENKFSKEEILFLYLNQVYLGGGYYGVKAAFKGYFDKELDEATPAEAALVAGLLVAPGKYSPYVNPQYAKRRQNYVLERMFLTKKITEEQYQAAIKENIKMRIRKINEFKGGHFTDWIRQIVMKEVGTEEFLTNGFTVTTTLDWSLQQKAESSVRLKVKDLDKRQGFKGPIKHFSSDQEIASFSQNERKAILKLQSGFFTFTTEGKNIFEFNENEDDFKALADYYKTEESKTNERFKPLVDTGNLVNDTIFKFIKENESYKGVVLKVDDLKRTILVEVAGVRVIIPESGFEWAHERKFSEDPVYFNPIKKPSKILKRGDQIIVTITDKMVPADQLIHSDFFKKYKDPTLKKLLAKQKFMKGILDQEPEVEGALLALNAHTGEVVSMVGGVDFQKSQFNRSLQSLRQPGSAFKPFIYAASLENGFNPSSIIMDSPQALGGVDQSLSWKPRNYDGEFRGPMTLRKALEISRNIPTIRLVQELGVKKINDFVTRWHINTDLPKDMSLSLGSFGISLAELTKAYAVFPNGGRAVRLKHISSITDRTGKSYPVPEADPAWPEEVVEQDEEALTGAANPNPFWASLNSTQVYDPRLSYIMSNILKGVTHYGTAAAAGKLSANIGGKTGTTNNYVDALFVGFSSNIVVGTWVGFDDNRPLGYAETGGRTALPMWMDFMASAINKYGDSEWSVPEGITTILVNKESGKPIPAGAGEGFLESFVTGFDPNSDSMNTFDNGSQGSAVKASSLDDESYWENQ